MIERCICKATIKWDARTKKQGFLICHECLRIHDWVRQDGHLSCRHPHVIELPHLGRGVYVLGVMPVHKKCLACGSYFNNSSQILDISCSRE